MGPRVTGFGEELGLYLDTAGNHWGIGEDS